MLLVFGVATLLLAALYLLDQRDYKRLLAYSSMEHMGILAIGVSFGAPIALAGVLLHVLAHAAAKGNAFMGSGVLLRKFGSKQISAARGGLDLLPWSGPLFLAAILALCAMPPFGIFRSEFEIVPAGWPPRQRARRDLVSRSHRGLPRAGAGGQPDDALPAPACFQPGERTPADAGRTQRLDGRARRRGPGAARPRPASAG